MQNENDFFATARAELPHNFALTAVPRIFPDIIAVGTIHNAISMGVGPAHRKINRRIVLERDSFIDWIQNRPSLKRLKNSEKQSDEV